MDLNVKYPPPLVNYRQHRKTDIHVHSILLNKYSTRWNGPH